MKGRILKNLTLFIAGIFFGGGLTIYSLHAIANYIVNASLNELSAWSLVYGGIVALVLTVIWIIFLYNNFLIWAITKKITIVFLSLGSLLALSFFKGFDIITIEFSILPFLFIFSTSIAKLVTNKTLSSYQAENIGLNINTGFFLGVIIFSVITNYIVSLQFSTTFFIIITIACFIIGFFILAIFDSLTQSFDETDLNTLDVKSKRQAVELFKNKYLRLLFLYGFFETAAIILLILLVISLLGGAYDNPDNIIVHISFSIIVAHLFGLVISSFFSEKIVKNYGKNIILIFSPVVVLLFMVAIFITGVAVEKVEYMNLAVPSIPVLLIYFALILLLILRLGFVRSIYASFFEVINGKYRLHSNLKIIWGGQLLAVLITGLFSVVLLKGGIFFLLLIITGVAILWGFFIWQIKRAYQEALEKVLKKDKKAEDADDYAFELVEQIEKDQRNKLKIMRLFNLLHILNPILYRKKAIEFINADEAFLQKLTLIGIKQDIVLKAIEPLNKLIHSKFMLVSVNASHVQEVFDYLTEIKERTQTDVYIPQLANCKIASERKLGAILCREIPEREQILDKLLYDDQLFVVHQALISADDIENPDLKRTIVSKLNTLPLTLATWVAIIYSKNKFIEPMEKAFHAAGDKLTLQRLIIRAYEQINTPETRRLLSEKIDNINRKIVEDTYFLMNEAAINVPDEKRYVIEEEIEETCTKIVWSLMALKVLTESDKIKSEAITKAIHTQISIMENRIFILLGIMFDNASINQVKQNRTSSDEEIFNFAQQLLDTVLPDKLVTKPWLIILLMNDDYNYKLREMLKFVPMENENEKSILEKLLIEEPNIANNWTKVCALEVYKDYIESRHDVDYIISALANSDPFVKDSAINILTNIKFEEISQLLERFKVLSENKHDISQNIITNFLIKEVPQFNGVPGFWLTKIAELTEVKIFNSEKIIPILQLNYAVVYKGIVKFVKHEQTVKEFKPGDFISYLDFFENEKNNINLTIPKDAILFVIKKDEFEILISEFNRLTESLYNVKDH